MEDSWGWWRGTGATCRAPFCGAGEHSRRRVSCSLLAGFHLFSMQPRRLASPTWGPWQAYGGEVGPRVRSADMTKRKHLLWETHLTDDLFLPSVPQRPGLISALQGLLGPKSRKILLHSRQERTISVTARIFPGKFPWEHPDAICQPSRPHQVARTFQLPKNSIKSPSKAPISRAQSDEFGQISTLV